MLTEANWAANSSVHQLHRSLRVTGILSVVDSITGVLEHIGVISSQINLCESYIGTGMKTPLHLTQQFTLRRLRSLALWATHFVGS